MSQKHGKVWWTELRTRDVPEALKYYRAVCGWHFEPMAVGNAAYQIGKRGDQPVVGVVDMTGQPGMDALPPHWFSYVAVDKLDRALDETRERGGEVVMEPFEIPYVGRIAIVRDPGGAAIGLIAPA